MRRVVSDRGCPMGRGLGGLAANAAPRMLPVLAFLAVTAGAPVVSAVHAQISSAPLEIHHIHGVALDRRDPEVLSIATHTGLVRLRANGVPEWVGPRFDLMGFTAHPAVADLVYASGHPDLATYAEQKVGILGLLVSRDGGHTWRSMALRGAADFHALAYRPRRGGELFGWSVAERPGLYRIALETGTAVAVSAAGLADVLSLAASPDPAGALLAGTKAGLFVSRDDGVTWTRLDAVPTAPVTGVASHVTDGRLVYAYLAQAGRGLLRSRDGGSSWESTGLALPTGSVAVALAVGPGTEVAVVTSGSDVFRSGDGGRTWQMILERGRVVSGR